MGLATKYGDFLARLLLTFTGVESDKAIRNIAVFSMYYFVYNRVCSSTSTDSTSLRDVGIHWAYIFIVFVPLGAHVRYALLCQVIYGEKDRE